MPGIGCERSQVEEIEITRASAADANEILSLQKLAYRSEAEIYDDWTLPPLHQTLEEITALIGEVDWEYIRAVKAETDAEIKAQRLAAERGDPIPPRRTDLLD